MDFQAELAQLRQDVQVMRQKIISLESELKNVKQRNESSVRETNAMNKYNTIVETIRKWDMHFSGERSENMTAFLNRVEENCQLVGLSYNDLLPYLSLLFKGTASIWYQTYRNEWKTWMGFRETAREWYGDNRIYQEALDDELEARVQGPDEPVRDYLIHATALMSKQDADFSNGKDYQLDMMYRNMRPEIKERMRRDEFDSVKKMLQLAISSEYSVELDKRYRPVADLPFIYVKLEEAKPKSGANVSSHSILTGDAAHQLDILYNHMQPYIKERVRRDEFDSVKKLLELIMTAESRTKLGPPLAKDMQISTMTGEDQLDLLYQHIVPHIKERVRRGDIDSVTKLLELIMRAEIDIEMEKKFLKDLNRKMNSTKPMHIGVISVANSANDNQGNRQPKRKSKGKRK